MYTLLLKVEIDTHVMQLFCYYFIAAKQQINEEFKKNKTIIDPAAIQNV